MVIAPLLRHALVLQEPDARRDRRIVGSDHAAFAGRDHLVAVKRKRSEIADRAHAQSADAGAVRLRSVFDDDNAARPSEREHGVHRGRVTV